ncbi:FGGY-family carbohydrate kinase [Streptomyces sp. ME109]
MKIIKNAAESETLARTVEDNGGVYFVPAFSGLFAPYWRSDARGAIVGLARYNDGGHLARATLEAICYQSRDVVEAMEQDSGVHLDVLKVDGGVTANDLCMHPGRCPRRPRQPPGRHGDHRAGRRLRGRTGHRFLAGPR